MLSMLFFYVEKVLSELNLLNKPEAVFNADETGFGRKEGGVDGKVFGTKGKKTKCHEVKMLSYTYI